MAKKVLGYCGNSEIFTLGTKEPIPKCMGIVRINVDEVRKLLNESLDNVHGYIEFYALPLEPENRLPYKTHSLKLVIDEV
jgi:hypothetical protein